MQILGWDASGVVEAVGEHVSHLKVGDEVYYAGSLTRQGSNQEYHLVDSRIVGFKPKSLDMAAAAAFPLVTLTAYESLFERLHISRDGKANGKTLLIVNGAGGVGSIAIQLAKVLAPGLKVIATAGKPESKEWVQKLGADHTISHHEPFKPQLEALGLPNGWVDYIYSTWDTKPIWEQLCDIVAPQGAINTIAIGPKDEFSMMPLYMKAAAFSTEIMFARGMYQTADIMEQHRLLTEVAGLIDAGKVKPIGLTNLGPISVANLTTGHESLEGAHVVGKIVCAGW